MKKGVSIIIPTYNRAEKLKKSIDSVLQQTYPYFELLIVDDASTDQTEYIVESFHDKRLRYIKNEKNVGPSVARNIGIRNAQYEYIAFNDSDDIWMKDKLEKQIHKMENQKQFGMVYCAYYLGDEKKKIKIPSDLFSRSDLEGDIFQSLWKANKIGTPTILVKRECIEHVGAFNEDLHSIEDWEFVLRIASHYKIGYINEILVSAHQSNTGVNSDMKSKAETFYFLMQKYEKKGFDISLKLNEIINRIAYLDEEQIECWKSRLVPKYIREAENFEEKIKNMKEKQKLLRINRLLLKMNRTDEFIASLQNNIDFQTDIVGIYGAGMIGEALARKLMELGINVYCLFDKNDIVIEGIDVKKPCQCSNITKLLVSIGENMNKCDFRKWIGKEADILNIYDILDG